jgi:hypothetical protein
MWKRLRVFLPARSSWRKLALACGTAGVIALAFCWGRWGALSEAAANPPGAGGPEPLSVTPTPGEYATRPVAYIYNSIPITREDLGEYLIARFGPERIDFFVNRRIIERECQSRGIQVTDAEVEAQLVEDLRSMNIARLEDFVNQVLKRFHKNLYEYKEDVIRPKLYMAKLCRPHVTVTDEDLQKAFEAHYGPKVKCKMIVFNKGTGTRLMTEAWTKIHEDPAQFDKLAREQPIKALAATGGDAPPIHKHFGNDEVERIAFGLQVNEVSQLIALSDGTSVILKCIEKIPADSKYRLEDERLKLHKEVMDTKLADEVQKTFKRLRQEADPKVFLQNEEASEMVYRRTDALLRAAGVPASPQAPSAAAAAHKQPLGN